MTDMTLDKVIKNLDNTIAGKEIMLEYYKQFRDEVTIVMAQFIDVNLKELNAIRADLLKVK